MIKMDIETKLEERIDNFIQAIHKDEERKAITAIAKITKVFTYIIAFDDDYFIKTNIDGKSTIIYNLNKKSIELNDTDKAFFNMFFAQVMMDEMKEED
jgi:hypothetical protein